MSVFRLNLIAVGIVSASTGAFVWGLLIPGMKELNSRQGQIQRESKQVELAQREVGDVSELYASILKLNEKTQSFRKRLPISRRLGEFRNDLEQCLRKGGITYYRPQELQAKEVNPEKLPASLALAEGTTILPIKLSFGATFSQVFEFLKRLESLERLSHVESMEIENSEEQAGQLSVQMIIHAYHRPED